MARRDALHSPRLAELRKKRRQRTLTKVLLLGFAAFVLVAGVSCASRLPRLNIKEVSIEGNKVVDAEDILAVVQENLEGKYLWLVPKRSILFYPKDSIRLGLEEKFPRLKGINFELNDVNNLKISLSEREGRYTWCGEGLPAPEVKREEYQCSFMDGSGYVFDSAPYFSGNLYFRFFGPLEGQKFEPQNFGKFIALIEAIEYLKLKPVSLYVKPDGDVEVYLSSNSVMPPKIIFKKDFELEKTSENLQAALATDPLKTDLASKYSLLKYIDLRFGNKVYFKFSD